MPLFYFFVVCFSYNTTFLIQIFHMQLFKNFSRFSFHYLQTLFQLCNRYLLISYKILFFSLIKEKSSGVDELNCYSDTEILASADTDLTLAQSKLYIYSKVVL
jgi:hypothetical protein